MSANSARESTSWRPVTSLAGVEGRKLVGHPVFLAGVGISLIGSAIFVRATTSHSRITWDDDAWTVSAGFVVLAMFTMIAANFATLRDRREHTTEQHASLPVSPAERTAGLLAAAAWPTAVAAALLVAIAAYGATKVPLLAVDRVHLLAQVVLIALMAVLGIALATWLPNSFVAPVAAWVVLFATPSEQPRPWQVLAPLAGPRDAGLSTWHIAYQVGLTIVIATLALAKTARRRTTIVGVIAGLALVVLSGAVLVPNACPTPGRCRF